MIKVKANEGIVYPGPGLYLYEGIKNKWYCWILVQEDTSIKIQSSWMDVSDIRLINFETVAYWQPPSHGVNHPPCNGRLYNHLEWTLFLL